MATFGPYNLTTFVSNAAAGAAAWTNPDRALTSGNTYATATLAAGAESRYLDGRTLVSPAVTGTVIGVKVEIEEKAAAAAVVSPIEIKLIVGGAIVGTSRHEGAVPTLSDADTYYAYGTTTDLWGLSLTAAQVNAEDFGIAVRYKNNDSEERVVSIDHIRVTIYTAGTPAAYSDAFPAGSIAANWRQMSQTLGSADDATDACVFTSGDDEFTAAIFAKPEDTTRVYAPPGSGTGVRVRTKIVTLAGSVKAFGTILLGSPKRHQPQVYVTWHNNGSGARILSWDGTGPGVVLHGILTSPVTITDGMWTMAEVLGNTVAVYASAVGANGPWTRFGVRQSELFRITGLAGVMGRHDSDSTIDDFAAEPITDLLVSDGLRRRVRTSAQVPGWLRSRT